MELKLSDIEPEMDIRLYELYSGIKVDDPFDIPVDFMDFLQLLTNQSKKYALVKHAITKGDSFRKIMINYRVGIKTIYKLRDGEL